jgi:HNH endonuclease
MFDFIRGIRFWWTYPRHPPHPASREFLDTHEAAKVRYQVLPKHKDRPCMAYGRGPRQGVWLNVDHIKPRKTRPHLALNFSNCQILCSDCNKGKGNWDPTDWR